MVVTVSSLQQNFTGSPKLKLNKNNNKTYQLILSQSSEICPALTHHFIHSTNTYFKLKYNFLEEMQDDNDIICLINTTQDSKPAIKRTRFINITMASSRNMYSICSSLASSEEN